MSWKSQLDDLEATGLRRTLRSLSGAQGPYVKLDGRPVLLLCSNNYLGLATHPLVIEALCRATVRYGAGSGGSRLISGSMDSHHQLEERLAAFKGTQRALLFNSGYAANCGILQGLFGEGDVIFSDALNHASIIDGCRLSRAATRIYPHGDVQALEVLLKAEAPRRRGRWLIVTDGVFSMDGDLAPLPQLVELKERFDCLLMVDDAHGTGVLGRGGRGSGEHLDCLEHIDLHMGTLGKALGVTGAYLAGSTDTVELLINRARSFVFSTSLPPGVAAAAEAALEIVTAGEGEALRRRLQYNRQSLTAVLNAGGVAVPAAPTPIVPIAVGAPQPTMEASRRLLEQGYFIQGIRPPTVPAGSCRLRATIMANHEPQDLEAAGRAVLKTLAGVAE